MKFFKTIFLLSFCLFVFASCEKDKTAAIIDASDSFEEEKREILEYLDAQNYNLDSIQFKGDMVFYETDMAWYRPDLMKTIHGEFILEEDNDPDLEDMVFAKDRQRSITENNRLDAIRRNNVASITYFIRPSVLADCGVNWINAINNAASEWTDISFCRVDMTRIFVEAAADIIIGSDLDTGMPTGLQNMTTSTIAAAYLPQNGIPGTHIGINSSYDWIPKKKTAIKHEMGHSLGFQHTGTNEGQQVHGTPINESGSLMNPSFWTATSSFKPGDIRMARMFYPDSYNMPANFTAQNLGNGELGISYQNPSYLTRPYYWIRLAVYDLSGNIVTVVYRRAVANTSSSNNTQTFILYGWKGDYLFALRGCNFRRDVWSPRTPQVLVNF